MAKAKTVGRNPNNENKLGIIDNPQVSKNHCVFYYEDNGEYYLMDLNSTNGTELNSERIIPMKRYKLEEHDIVAIRLQGQLPIFLKWKNYFFPDQIIMDLEELDGGDMENTIKQFRKDTKDETSQAFLPKLINKIKNAFKVFILISILTNTSSCLLDFNSFDNKSKQTNTNNSKGKKAKMPSLFDLFTKVFKKTSGDKFVNSRILNGEVISSDKAVNLRNSKWNKYKIKRRTATYYSRGKNRMQFDIYTPEYNNPNKKIPLIIFLHQGGFIFGSKSDFIISQYCKDLSKAGYVVASLDYTKINEKDFLSSKQLKRFAQKKYITTKIYEAVQDVHSAISYFTDNAHLWNIDKNNVFLAGYSAGGILSLMATFSDNNEISRFIGNNLYKEMGGINAKAKNKFANYHISGTISLAGGIVNIGDLPVNNSTPILLMHGTNDDVISPGHDLPFKFLRKDHHLDMPGLYLKLGIFSEDEETEAQYNYLQSGVHIPAWIMQILVKYYTFPISGSSNIANAYDNSNYIKFINGDHSFMVNEKGEFNENYQVSREAILRFVKKFTN